MIPQKFEKVLRAAFVELSGNVSNPQKVADEMFSNGGITLEELEEINAIPRERKTDKMRELLLMLLRKDVSTFKKFLASLERHAVHLYLPLKKVYDNIDEDMTPDQVKKEWDMALNNKRKFDDSTPTAMMDETIQKMAMDKSLESYVQGPAKRVRKHFEHQIPTPAKVPKGATKRYFTRVIRADHYYHCPQKSCTRYKKKLSEWICMCCKDEYSEETAGLGIYAHLEIMSEVEFGVAYGIIRAFGSVIEDLYYRLTGEEDIIDRVRRGESLFDILQPLFPAIIPVTTRSAQNGDLVIKEIHGI